MFRKYIFNMIWYQPILDLRTALAFDIRGKMGGWTFREGVKNVQLGGRGGVPSKTLILT